MGELVGAGGLVPALGVLAGLLRPAGAPWSGCAGQQAPCSGDESQHGEPDEVDSASGAKSGSDLGLAAEKNEQMRCLPQRTETQ